MPEIEAKSPVFLLDEVEIDPGQGVLRRGSEDLYLRRKSFQILIFLIEERERVVSKDELATRFWSETAVTDDAIVQCIVDIRKVLGDDSRDPRYLKTFPKSGYRFIGDVRLRPEEEIEGKAESEMLPTQDRRRTFGLRRAWWMAGAGVLLVALAAGFVANREKAGRPRAEVVIPRVPGKTSIAVMFFDNQSGAADLDWMREGLADMLITDLYRSDKLTLLSRQQLYLLLERLHHQDGASIRFDEALEAANKSQAEKFILGSFNRLGNQIRIDVRIHDVSNGALIASDSAVSSSPEEILTQMDSLATRLAGTLVNQRDSLTSSRGLTEVMTRSLDAYRYYSLAVEKSRAYHNVEALELLKKAIRLDPEFAMAHARIGYTLSVSWGQSEEGRPHLERAIALSNQLTARDRLYVRAWHAISRLDYPEAISTLRELISNYPGEIEAYQRLGYLLRGEGRTEEALQVLLKGLKVDPEAPDLFNAAGLIYSDKSMHTEAIQMHKRYVELLPGEPNAHDSLAMSYQQAGMFDEAIAEYSKALSLNPEFDIAVTHLSNAYFQMGRYKDALAQARRYLQIAPSNRERLRGHYQAARVYLELGDIGRATVEARAATGTPRIGDWLFLAIARANKDLAEYRIREKEISKEPSFDNRGQRISGRLHHYSRGWLAMDQGRIEEGLAEFREALQHLPPIWFIDTYEDCLGNALLSIGKPADALKEYQRILALNPRYPKLHFHIARAYELLGNKALALEEYRKFLEVWKDADANISEVREAARKIETGI